VFVFVFMFGLGLGLGLGLGVVLAAAHPSQRHEAGALLAELVDNHDLVREG
jgi:hypothetical protein